MKIYKIPLWVWSTELIWVDECTAEELADWSVKQYGIKREEILCNGNVGKFLTFFKDGQTDFVLWCKEIDFSPYHEGVLAHECLHATFAILKKAGVQYDSEASEEAYTYLLEHIFRDILKRKGERIKQLAKRKKK